jgi:nucleoside-diphosphate-sugar epimerase
MNKVLLTGGTGCIGAATTHHLISRGADEVVIASRSATARMLSLWFPDKLDPRIKLVKGDVSDADEMRELVHSVQPTRIIHLGALQTPDCDASPVLGMEVNVGGTLNLLNAAADLGDRIERFVFASSAAVYGPRSIYPGETVEEDDRLAPPNLYGVWKAAGEQLTRLFHEKTGVPAVCLRLNTTYGKGRDRGKTSASTAAMKAVALGHARGEKIPFRMPYFGRENYHYVADVGAHFASCALDPFGGFGAFNIRGETVEVEEFLRLIEKSAESLGMLSAVDLGIAPDVTSASFVCDLDDRSIQAAFPGLPRTPLETGIRLSLDTFGRMAADGRLTAI